MNKVVSWIVGIVVVLGILYGIYYFLPEFPHAGIQSVFQPMVDANAKAKINEIKNIKNDRLNMTYDEILTSEANDLSMKCWVYESSLKSADGYEHVRFYSKGATINLKDVEGAPDMLYTSAALKVDFVISAGKVDIQMYIDGSPIYKANAPRAQKETIKQTVFSQLAGNKVSLTK